MREIKFRAWDTKEEKLIIPHSFYLENGNLGDFGNGRYIFQQYTGLKDKNGKEIYEGDIVKREEPDEDSAAGNTFTTKGIVTYGTNPKAHHDSDYPTSFCLWNKEFYGEHALIYKRGAELEVIGNIYENPDLIK